MTKMISLIVGILVGICSLGVVGYNLDCRWAKPNIEDHDVLAGDVRGMKERNTWESIWQIEGQYGPTPQHQWSPRDLERYKRLKLYLQCLQQGRKDCGYSP